MRDHRLRLGQFAGGGLLGKERAGIDACVPLRRRVELVDDLHGQPWWIDRVVDDQRPSLAAFNPRTKALFHLSRLRESRAGVDERVLAVDRQRRRVGGDDGRAELRHRSS
jgi:hypothetical protein